MTDPVRPAGARTSILSTCEPLEPRRLLAVVFDSNFGDAGFTSLRSPFAAEDTNGAGEDVSNPIFPHLVSELAGNYIAFATHLVLDASDNAISAEAVHALVERDGTPSGDLEKDSDGDGLSFFTLQQRGPNQFSGPGQYSDWVSLPNGTALALDTDEDGDQRVARILADGSEAPFFSMDEFTQIHAIEALSEDIGVLVASVPADDAEEPIGAEDLVLQVQLFATNSGDLLPDGDVLPFGQWLRSHQVQGPTTLHVGRDGAVYVATVTNDIDGSGGGSSGFLVSRLLRAGAGLEVDEFFGTSGLPGQTTSAAFLPSSVANSPQFDFVGATPGRRAWVRMPNPGTGASAKSFALLSVSGQLDPTFGDNGVLSVDFLSDGVLPLEDGSPTFIDADSFIAAPRPFVRGDGSLLGVTRIPAGTTPLPTGGPFEFLVGVYGVLTDGSFDPRIAEPGSAWGAGRTIVGADVDGLPGNAMEQIQAATYLDAEERIVILSEATTDSLNSIDLVFTRLLVGTPRAELVDRLDGNRVLEIEGTSAADRLILRSGAEGAEFHLFTQPVGGLESLVGVFSSAQVDLVEMSGGEGDDVLFNEVNDEFTGFVTLFGGNGSDTLSSHGTYARLFGEDGNDTILGGLGDQLIFGGLGDDSLTGGSGRDALFGETGNDVLRGQLNGDLLDGGDGNDTLAGDEANDTLVGGPGDDSMVGNDGVDLVSYAALAEDVSVRLGTSENGPVAGFESDFVDADVENALGGTGNDSIVGSDGRNFLLGGQGNDTLLGLGGKDTLLGGAGSDLMDGGDDLDLLLDDDAIGSDPPFPTLGVPDTLVGGEGLDMALVGSAETDEVLETERIFLTLEELLEVLNA